MAIFELISNGLKQVKENPFKLEKDIQKLVEKNLPALLGLN